MKRDTLQSKKFKRLVRATGKPPVECCGILQFTWDWTARNNPDGKLDGEDLRDLGEDMGYAMEDGQSVFAAMLETGWIDEIDGGVFVHDWPDHCETSTHLTLARSGKSFADGTLPSITKLSKQDRQRLPAQTQKDAAHAVRTKSPQDAHAVRTTDTDALAITDTDTEQSDSEAHTRSDIGFDSNGPYQKNAKTRKIVDRIIAVTRDPPEFIPYWVTMGQRLKRHGQLDTLLKNVDYLERSRGIREPNKWLTKACDKVLKQHGDSAPQKPTPFTKGNPNA